MPFEALRRIGDSLPGRAEELALHRRIFKAGIELTDAHTLSREDVAKQPMSHQDVAIESHGYHLMDLALDTTALLNQAANYNEFGPGPHYIEVGSGYWFNFRDQRLVQRTWRQNRIGLYRPDFENAPDASARDWYTYAAQVVDGTVSAFQKVHQLPKSLREPARYQSK